MSDENIPLIDGKKEAPAPTEHKLPLVVDNIVKIDTFLDVTGRRKIERHALYMTDSVDVTSVPLTLNYDATAKQLNASPIPVGGVQYIGSFPVDGFDPQTGKVMTLEARMTILRPDGKPPATLREALSLFDACAKKRVDEMQQKALQKKIIENASEAPFSLGK